MPWLAVQRAAARALDKIKRDRGRSRGLFDRQAAGLAPLSTLSMEVAARRYKSGWSAPYDMRPPASTYPLKAKIVGSRLLATTSASRARCVVKSGVSACSSPSMPRRALSAESKSSASRTATAPSLTPSARATVSAPSSCLALVGCGGCDSVATRLAVGISSLSSCRRLPAISAAFTASPVMLAPGVPDSPQVRSQRGRTLR